jgi:hypothetical protein
MEKTICDSIRDLDSRFEGQMINGIVNCLALQHGRFNEAVMTLGATSSSLSYDPLNSELYQRAWHVRYGLKSDLWFHLELENALVFLWNGHQLSSGLDFVGELSREQQEIRELVRKNGFRARHREHRALAHLRLPGSLTTDRVAVIEAGRLPGLSFSLMEQIFRLGVATPQCRTSSRRRWCEARNFGVVQRMQTSCDEDPPATFAPYEILMTRA